MLILSRSPAIWLWQTLLYQVSHPDRLRNVHTAPADLSCAELAHRLENAPRLERLASEAALIHGKRVAGLTHAELKVILALLQGQTIGEQARRLGLSQKTLYTQRLAGVKKLVECHPHLAPAFRVRCCRAHPPAHCRRLNRNGYKRSTIARSSRFFNLSSIVAHSYRGGDPDPLAPPRPLPQTFLPHFRADYTWLLLTAFVLQEAVQNINEYPGTFYFSVNIPPRSPTVIACCGWWKPLASSSGSQRAWKGWCWNMLKLSIFAIRADPPPRWLQRAGVRVMLDDCFSQGSVIFPARRLHFNAYKLDMSIVNDAQHDQRRLR
jgi:DNA-binding CsgD family transcriptional regulator